MSDDHLLLQQVLEDHEITVKQLALATGYARQTIYNFLEGRATTPSIVWRTLYGRTRDRRILKLVVGEVPVIVHDAPAAPLHCDVPGMERLLGAREKQLEVEQSVLAILRDGVIDERDRRDVRKYKRDFEASIADQYQLYAAILDRFRTATQKTKGTR